jgi:hypothetical protein
MPRVHSRRLAGRRLDSRQLQVEYRHIGLSGRQLCRSLLFELLRAD